MEEAHEFWRRRQRAGVSAPPASLLPVISKSDCSECLIDAPALKDLCPQCWPPPALLADPSRDALQPAFSLLAAYIKQLSS